MLKQMFKRWHKGHSSSRFINFCRAVSLLYNSI